MKRKPKFVQPPKYILMIMTGVCVVIMLLSFTLNISGGPLNAVAGYIFVPMQRGINTVGSWITEQADNFKNLNEVMAENEALRKQVDELTVELNTVNLEQYELENLRELFELIKNIQATRRWQQMSSARVETIGFPALPLTKVLRMALK